MSIKQRLAAAGISGVLLMAGAGVYELEGEVRKPYQDVGGIGTVCMGSTQYISKPVYTAEECLALLVRDTKTHLEAVQRVAPEGTPQSVVEAMTSVSYNVGIQGFYKSPMLAPLVIGDWQAACSAIVAPWTTSKGTAFGYRATVNLKPHKGLENRRAKEYAVCVRDLR